MRRAGSAAASLALLGLALACSSGGGGDDEEATALITSGNAVEISAKVLQAIALSASVSTIGLGLDADGTSPALAETLADVPRLEGGGTVFPAFGPSTQACAESGSVTVSGEVADVEQPSVGDRIRAEYDACDRGDGAAILDGILAYVIRTIQGDFANGLFRLILDIELSDFSATNENGARLDVSGVGSLGVDTTAPPFVQTSLRGGEAGEPPADIELSNFVTSLIQDLGSDTYSIDGGGEVRSSDADFQGVAFYDTLEVLTGEGDQPPDDGVVLIMGAGDATIRVVPIDAVNVELELDLDGDGSVDGPPLTVSWAALGL